MCHYGYVMFDKNSLCLIVDDFSNFRTVLRGFLLSSNVNQIYEASNAREATKLIDEHRFDVVLCDYNLGKGPTGQQVLEYAKFNHLIGISTIFIMITAETSMDMVINAIEYKPDDYLAKPFTRNVLMKRLDRIAHKKNNLKNIDLALAHNNYQKAMKLSEQALLKGADNQLEIVRVMGYIKMESGHWSEAETLYRNVLKKASLIWARVGLSKALIELGQPKDAMPVLYEMLEDNNKNMEAYDLLAKAFIDTNEKKKAQYVLQDAVHISPNSISRQRDLGKLALENKQLNVAENALKNCIKHGKQSYIKRTDEYFMLADIYTETGEMIQALKVVKNAGDAFKDDVKATVETHLKVAQIQLLNGDEKEAEIAAFKARKLLEKNGDRIKPQDLQTLKLEVENLDVTHDDPDEIESRQCINNKDGMDLYRKGAIKESIPLFQAAVHELPNNVSINLNAAQAIIMLMKKDGVKKDGLVDAKKYLDIVSDINPQHQRYQRLSAMMKELVK